MTLLWYVHHHGTGHWRRAIAVATLLETPVTFLSSLRPPWSLPPHGRFVELPLDTPGDSTDADAGGALHWAPLGQPGLLDRHRIILEAAAVATRAVVDVSVEVAVLLRVSGIDVTLVELPGARGDRPHRLAHELAGQVLTPVPATWQIGVTPIGLVSMLNVSDVPRDPEGPVVVVNGAGGGSIPASSLALLAEDHHVVVAEGDAAIGPLLASASVVVGGAGLGTVADVAAARRPFVIFPAERPHGEQAATAAACAAHENAVVRNNPPISAKEWRELIGRAFGAGAFAADVGGAARFAQLLQAS